MAPLAETIERLVPQLGELEGEPSPLDGGITNRNFRARFGGREVVIRLPGARTELLGADRTAEREASARAAAVGIAPELLAAEVEPAYLVFEFVAGETMSAGRLREPATLEAVAAALQALHGCEPIAARPFDSFRLVEDYAQAIAEHGGEVPAAHEEAAAAAGRIEAARNGAGESVLCHNDMLAANFIAGEAGLQIVDWEYAGMGDRFFDLANFAVNNGLDDVAEEAFLAAYLDRAPTGAELAALRLMRVMSDYREAMWGVVQRTVSDIDFDFDAYAREHFERLLVVVGDPAFERNLREAAGAAG